MAASANILRHGNIEVPRQTRAAGIAAGSYDKNANTVDVIWTTGASVRRLSWMDGPYDEVLMVEPGAVRLGRLNAGAPFLNTHGDWDLSDVIGSVVPGTARLADGQGLATIQLSPTEEDADVVQKIAAGIIRSISVGYRYHKVEKIDNGEGEPQTWRVVDWEPLEISAVPVGADPGAQVRGAERSARELYPCLVTRVGGDRGSAALARMRMRARQFGFAI
jgi:HK97 family phage prohead protease